MWATNEVVHDKDHQKESSRERIWCERRGRSSWYILDDKDSDDEKSSESSDECLHIDTQEDIRTKM